MKSLKIGAAALALAAMSNMTSTPAYAQAGTQFIGQISAFGGNFCPRGWANANGALLPISQNQALFAILGTQFGGDGRTTLGLPNLSGRRPIGAGNAAGIGDFRVGQFGGSIEMVILPTQMPAHSHDGLVAASPSAGNSNQPVRNSFAATPDTVNNFATGDPAVNNMHPDILRINATGGGQVIQKLSPFQAVQWCVATTGIFPSRN